MSRILQEVCFHHPRREGVARCPECGRFFCRECITEHEARVICASCLRTATVHTEKHPFRWSALAGPFQLAAGLLIAWLFFYGLGQVLVSIPADFHAGGWRELPQEFWE